MTTRILSLALVGTVGLTGVLLAVQNQQPNQQPVQDDPDIQIEVQEDEQQQRLQRQNLQETSQRQQRQLVHRASALIGMEVQNSQGQDLGEIEDLVIADEGKVEYAAVSFGGFAGIGDKLFAVPFAEVQLRQEDPQSDDWIAVMNVTEQQLENAQGFDKDNWPDMANEQWKTQNDRAFRTTERLQRDVEQTTPRR